MSSFLLGTCPEVESLGHMIGVWRTNLFLECLYLFAFWPAMRERSSSFSLGHTVTAVRLSSHSLRLVRVSIFSCAYLPFVYLFYWSVYSNLYAFLIFFLFPYYWLLRVRYIYSKYNIFVRHMTYKYFLQYFFIIFFFHYLSRVFWKAELQPFDKVQLIIFFLWFMLTFICSAWLVLG